jgi:hypothetical protein
VTDHTRICRDLDCPAHGPLLRRIRRLALALAAERERRGKDPMAVPVMDVTAEDQEAEGARYAAEVEAWQAWRKSPMRDERGMGWDRAHTTLCGKVPCHEHRNPYMRTRG